MNAFHVLGGLFALWALIVSALGITRHDFPRGSGGEKLVAAISILLALGAIASAVLTGATEGEEEPEGGAAGVVLPLH